MPVVSDGAARLMAAGLVHEQYEPTGDLLERRPRAGGDLTLGYAL
jgi:hypothetical protein